MAWPAYMADEFSATLAEASAGASPTSRACCAELDEKQPSAHGMPTSTASSSEAPSGNSSRLVAMSASPVITAGPGPMRSMWRVISTLPSRPKAPKHRK